MNAKINRMINRPVMLASVVIVALALAVPFAAGQFSGSLAQAQAQTSLTGVVTAGRINVRSGPSMGYTVIATAGEGEQVAVLGRVPGSSWLEIRTAGGVTGWAGSGNIELPAGETTASLPITGDYEPSAYVTTGMLNVRTGPDTSYDVVTTLEQYAGMGLLGRNHNASWVFIRLPGEVFGWVGSGMIESEVDMMTLPHVNTAGSAPSTPPSGSQPGSEPGSVPATYGTVTTTTHTNLRTDPDITAPILTPLETGVVLTLIGRNHDATFAFVDLPGEAKGWVPTTAVAPSEPIFALPVVNEKGVITRSGPPSGTGTQPDGQGGGGGTPSAPAGTAVVMTGALNVRVGPGIGYDVRTIVYQGETVLVFARNYNGSWYKVKTESGIFGWLNSAYVEFITLPVDIPYEPD